MASPASASPNITTSSTDGSVAAESVPGQARVLKAVIASLPIARRPSPKSGEARGVLAENWQERGAGRRQKGSLVDPANSQTCARIRRFAPSRPVPEWPDNDSKSRDLRVVRVRPPPPAPIRFSDLRDLLAGAFSDFSLTVPEIVPAPRSILAAAFLSAVASTIAYRRWIDSVLCPAIAIAAARETPSRSRFRTAERRMSCSRRPVLTTSFSSSLPCAEWPALAIPGLSLAGGSARRVREHAGCKTR